MLTIQRSGSDPQANLDYEEALFGALRETPRPTLLFYVNAPCIVLGRGNLLEQWVDTAASGADGVPVLRRFTGGGTVYHDARVLNYSFFVPRTLLNSSPGAVLSPAQLVDFGRGILCRALARGGGVFEPRGLSDINCQGRKISGTAQRIAATLALFHGSLLLECPLREIERYLPIPPNRPGVAHRDFITGLAEAGYAHSAAQIRTWMEAEFAAAVGYGE